VNAPERVIPALVRFERINRFYRFWPHALYFSSLAGFVSIKTLRERKHGVFRGSASGNLDEVNCEMVERSSQVMDEVTGYGNGIKRELGEFGKLPVGLASIRILLGDNYCHALVPESSEFGLQVEEVLFGPLDFYADQNDSVLSRGWHGGYDDSK
jgi:hypothetical protein